MVIHDFPGILEPDEVKFQHLQPELVSGDVRCKGQSLLPFGIDLLHQFDCQCYIFLIDLYAVVRLEQVQIFSCGHKSQALTAFADCRF